MENATKPVVPVAVPKQPAPNIMKKFSFGNKENLYLALGALVVVLLGGVTGWFLSGRGLISGQKVGVAAPGAKSGQNEAGIADESTFKDSAEGVLESGGISGEGTHHLVRDGGASQYVYLTSTAIDLESFVGKKVKVWGQTISAKKAGWLMDVGKIKTVN